MLKIEEVPFRQEFDIIKEKTRFVLDIEKEKYPSETVTFYLNGSTGRFSTKLEDVIREDVPYIEEEYNLQKNSEVIGYSIEYVKDCDAVVFHGVVKPRLASFREGTRYVWEEFDRFVIDEDGRVFIKKNGYTTSGNGRTWLNTTSCKENLEKSEDGVYESCYETRSRLPYSDKHFLEKFQRYVNAKTGEKDGFLKEISNIFPSFVNLSGNEYICLNNYSNMYKFLEMKNGDGLSRCSKKTGKKQDAIDKFVAQELPEIRKPEPSDNASNDMQKFAVIQRVPNMDACVVRTCNYLEKEDVVFEGGRIYVTKTTVDSCKKNNDGEYVAQPLLNNVSNWDFDIEKFSDEDTKGTILEYFGQIVQDISPDNRGVAIWMFLKEPFLESLAKISDAEFIDRFIECVRLKGQLSYVYGNTLGIEGTGKKGTKVFQVLGMSKQQFDSIKDILVECLPKEYYDSTIEDFNLTCGIIPFIKKLMTGDKCGDISSYDINTFKDYLKFATDLYSLYDICNITRHVNTDYQQIDTLMSYIAESIALTKNYYPNFDCRQNFDLFSEIANRRWNKAAYYMREDFTTYNDMLSMSHRVADKIPDFKPKIKSCEDLLDTHDNLQIMITYANSRDIIEKFKARHELWDRWVFSQEEKKDKEGSIKQEGLKFIVVRPELPTDLAREGTTLHHCVKSYIDKVANAETNIMFIRKADDPRTPFFTVEVDNAFKIQQVHGFGNRNADTEEGLEDFLQIWSKKKHLKLDGYNKVR